MVCETTIKIVWIRVKSGAWFCFFELDNQWIFWATSIGVVPRDFMEVALLSNFLLLLPIALIFLLLRMVVLRFPLSVWMVYMNYFLLSYNFTFNISFHPECILQWFGFPKENSCWMLSFKIPMSTSIKCSSRIYIKFIFNLWKFSMCSAIETFCLRFIN